MSDAQARQLNVRIQISAEMIRDARGGEFQRAVAAWCDEIKRDMQGKWGFDGYMLTHHDPDLWIDKGL